MVLGSPIMRTLMLILLALAACDTEPQTVVECEPPAPTMCEPTIVEKVVPAACEVDLPPEPAVPDGFPAEDEFPDDAIEAGKVITSRLVCSKTIGDSLQCKDKDENYRRLVIYRHWERRISWASGKGKWTSKLGDGTKIHDRDRPAGYKFWYRAVEHGWLTPASCSWHRIDPHIGHSDKEMAWALTWPFTSSPMSRTTLDTWMLESHDFERFVARGPNDGSPAYMNRYMPDRCFDPAQFDRNDVSAYAHARKTQMLCLQANADGVVCTYRYLRCTWGSKGRARCAAREAAAEAAEGTPA